MLRNPISTLRIFALVMLLGYQPAAFGQAYCARRDPIESIGSRSAQFFAGRHGLLTEVSLGNNDGTDVLNGLVEWNFRNRRESLLFYTQFGYFSEDRANGNEAATNAKIGVRFQPNNHWSVSAQYTRDLDTFSGANKERDLSLQLRFRL